MRRSCTSHLSRVKKELLDRLHITRKDQSNPKPTKKNNRHARSVRGKVGLLELVAVPWGSALLCAIGLRDSHDLLPLQLQSTC